MILKVATYVNIKRFVQEYLKLAGIQKTVSRYTNSLKVYGHEINPWFVTLRDGIPQFLFVLKGSPTSTWQAAGFDFNVPFLSKSPNA